MVNALNRRRMWGTIVVGAGAQSAKTLVAVQSGTGGLKPLRRQSANPEKLKSLENLANVFLQEEKGDTR